MRANYGAWYGVFGVEFGSKLISDACNMGIGHLGGHNDREKGGRQISMSSIEPVRVCYMILEHDGRP